MSDRPARLSWAAFVDVGLAHVEHLSDREDRHDRWVAVASDVSSLVVIERVTGAALHKVLVYRPGPRPAGGTSTMRDWVFDWERTYDDLGQLLDDVAAIAG